MTNDNKTHKTSSTADFFAKYKDPRWQKKRLEKMQSAKFRCESCESEDKTLNVHHKSYKKNHNPWEYDKWELECLCEDCHAEKHKIKDRLADALHEFKVSVDCSERPEEELLGFLNGRMSDGQMRFEPISYDYLRGYCMAHTLDVDEINANGKLLEIIKAADGWLEYEMFRFAFTSWEFSRGLAERLPQNIVNGEFSYYPDWLIEKILKQVAKILDNEIINS